MQKLRGLGTLPELGQDVLVQLGRGDWEVRYLCPQNYWSGMYRGEEGTKMGWYPGGMDVQGILGWTWLPNTPKRDRLVWRPHYCEVPYKIGNDEYRDYAIKCLRCKHRGLNYKADQTKLEHE